MPLYSEIRGDVPWELYVPGTPAGTALEVPGLRCPFNATVTAAYWIPNAAVTANGTNYATLSLRNRTNAGSGSAIPASRAYSATNSVAQVSEAMTLSGTATDLQFAAGDVITLGIAHTGTGLIIPPGLVQLALRSR